LRLNNTVNRISSFASASVFVCSLLCSGEQLGHKGRVVAYELLHRSAGEREDEHKTAQVVGNALMSTWTEFASVE